MKKTMLACAGLFIAWPVFAEGSVRVNEVAWMGTEANSNAEWIELYNEGSNGIDLAGWQLEAADGTPKINLAGSIGAGEFFVLERTNDSALPEVVADQTYSGALGNSGEILILKDGAGTEIFRLDGGGGWPGGDNDTKETLQWNGTAWITAEGTPGEANAAQGSAPKDPEPTVSSTTPSGTPSSHSSEAPVSNRTITKLVLEKGRDRLVTVGSEMEYEAVARDSKGEEVGGAEYEWSFGDATHEIGSSVEHAYEFPGTYVVIVNAKKDRVKAVSRFLVTAVEADIRLGGVTPEYVEIVNGSKYEANVQGWKIRVGGRNFELPKDTIILPESSVKLSRRAHKLDRKGDVKLIAPFDEKKTEERPQEEAEEREATTAIEAPAPPVIVQNAPLPVPERVERTLQVLPPMAPAATPAKEEIKENQTMEEEGETASSLQASVVQIYEGERTRGFLGGIGSWVRGLFR